MLLLLLETSIAALIFAIGMTAVTADIVYLWRRPVLLEKSVAAMYVLMPAVAVLILKTFLLLLGIGINYELDKSFLRHLYHSKVVTMVLYFNQRTDRRYKISYYFNRLFFIHYKNIDDHSFQIKKRFVRRTPLMSPITGSLDGRTCLREIYCTIVSQTVLQNLGV